MFEILFIVIIIIIILESQTLQDKLWMFLGWDPSNDDTVALLKSRWRESHLIEHIEQILIISTEFVRLTWREMSSFIINRHHWNNKQNLEYVFTWFISTPGPELENPNFENL